MFLVTYFCSFAQNLPQSNSGFLDSLFKGDLKKYEKLLTNPGKYRLQVLYTKIDRDQNNHAIFTTFGFHVTNNYIYPASTVKLPLAIVALIKLNELNKPGLNRATTMITDSAFYCQKKIAVDSTAPNFQPSIEHYIKKMFLVSDNNAFARTYEFVGYDYMHAKFKDLGYNNIRLFNRLDGQCPGDTAKVTSPVYFLGPTGDTLYKQPLTFFNEKLIHPIKSSTAGRFHQGNKGRWLAGPKDFARHNYFELSDLHRLMQTLVFNNDAGAKEKLPIDENSRLFMLKQLGMYPGESEYPLYDKKIFFDSYKKYFVYGNAVATINQDSLRVINIVGRAYGFLIDCAYIIDFKNKVEFLLSASVYVNENGRIGSGKYEYDRLGHPFLKDLSLCIYNYERNRKREVEPDLSAWRNLFLQK